MSEAAGDGDLTEGQQVTFVGLVGRVDLNGSSAILGSFDSSSGRWQAIISGSDSGESVNVKPANLKASPPASGSGRSVAKTTLGQASPPASIPWRPVAKKGFGQVRRSILKTKALGKGRRFGTGKVATTPCNVEPQEGAEPGAGLAGGKTVVITSPQARQDLNGTAAELLEFDDERGRWSVKFLSAAIDETMWVKPANLVLGDKKLKVQKTIEKRVSDKVKAPRPKKAPVMPKRAASSYLLFCKKYRQEVMWNLRKEYGSVDIIEISKILAERWADASQSEKAKFEKQASKRKELREQKMQVYIDATDPIAALRKHYDHMIPKRATTPYFVFLADKAQREKAVKELKRQRSKLSVTAKLTELWKVMTADQKAYYEEKFKNDKLEYEAKLQLWQQTPEFAELNALETEQREAQKAEKKEQQDSEDVAVEAIMSGPDFGPGQGLAVNRLASIFDLKVRTDLNGKVVELVEFDAERERWNFKLTGDKKAEMMSLKAENLMLTRTEASAKRGAAAAKKAQAAAAKEAQKAEKEAQKVALVEAQQAAKAEAEKAALAEANQAAKQAQKAERDAQKAALAEAKKAAKDAQKAEKNAQKAALAEAKQAEKDAQKAARGAQKAQDRAAKGASRAATKANPSKSTPVDEMDVQAGEDLD